MDNLQSTLKHLSLLEEIETASKLIQLGFGELQNLGKANDFYFLPFQLLSQGFERLMKSHICLGYHYQNGRYPNSSYLKQKGHDLMGLKAEILKNYFLVDNRQILVADYNFLDSDEQLNELLEILSEFGKLARYYNFDVITDSSKKSIDPKARWREFENSILEKDVNYFNQLENWDTSYELHEKVVRHVIVIFEKFVSALCRQFNFGGLGEKGKQLSSMLFDFSLLHNDSLGIKDYRKSTTTFQSRPKTVHRRTPIDFIQRRLNPNYKWIKVKRCNFEGEWPFYVDEVVVEQRYQHWCIITIDGSDYGLNGTAQGRYRLQNPHDAGVAVLGKSIQKFIDIALNL